MSASRGVVPLPLLAAPPDPDDGAVQEKLDGLSRIVRSCGSAVVAYSGGVDSSLVAAVAQRELGARALSVTVASAFLPSAELSFAKTLAGALGAAHRVIGHDVSSDENLMANREDRCYHCKFAEYGALLEIARAEGYAHVLDGTQTDDAAEAHRPGLAAALQHGVRSPLREAGITKAQVRAVSVRLGLPTADKPSAPCLASRFPYGERITVRGLRTVESAEAALHALGFRDLRVRIHPGASGADLGRIELDPEGLARMADVSLRDSALAAVRAAGFLRAEVDPAGYRPSVPAA